MPFFIIKKEISRKVAVYVIEADNIGAATETPLIEGDYQGWYSDTPASAKKTLDGPFESKEEATKNPNAWVEDI